MHTPTPPAPDTVQALIHRNLEQFERALQQGVAAWIAARNGAGHHALDQRVVAALASLTARQLEVARLACDPKSLTKEQMAQKLGLTTTAVDKHLAAVYRKLRVHDRMQLLWVAIRYGVVGVW